MKSLLNIMSIGGSFLITFCGLFLLQKYTIGRISILKNWIILGGLRVEDLIFISSSLWFILFFVEFYIPKRDYLK